MKVKIKKTNYNMWNGASIVGHVFDAKKFCAGCSISGEQLSKVNNVAFSSRCGEYHFLPWEFEVIPETFKVGDYVRLKKEFYKESAFKEMTRSLRQCVASLKNGKSNVLGVMDSKRDYGSIVIAHGEDIYILPPCIFELVEPEKKPVVEVKRKAKVGEWIKVVNAEGAKDRYKNGDILKVQKSTQKFVETFGVNRIIYHEEYVVLENYEPPKKREDVFDAFVSYWDALSNALSEHARLATKTRKWTPDEIVKAKCFLAEELVHHDCSFARDGQKTVCYNFGTCKVAKSKPSPNDEYSEYIGAVVAYCKTCGVKIPKFITH